MQSKVEAILQIELVLLKLACLFNFINFTGWFKAIESKYSLACEYDILESLEIVLIARFKSLAFDALKQINLLEYNYKIKIIF